MIEDNERAQYRAIFAILTSTDLTAISQQQSAVEMHLVAAACFGVKTLK